ncbi:MAG: prepilin-type N-terminal cleavage/methylation domain-containing protein [Bacilli bacterium]|nr:prepilin-type N-terminal cleavage/methylation domain-containing protein [Bacilli bacterium]
MKKGFTLAEVLAVVAILGLLLLLIAPNILNRINSKNEVVEDVQKKMIYNATDMYMEQNSDIYPATEGNVYCMSISDMVSAGILSQEYVDLNGKGTTIEQMWKSVEVTITSDKGGKSYKLYSENECRESLNDKIEFAISPSNKKWSTSKTVTIKFPTLGPQYSYYYMVNGGEENLVQNGKTTTITISDNAKETNGIEVTAYVKNTVDSDQDEAVINGQTEVLRIDTDKPECSWEITDTEVSLTAEDKSSTATAGLNKTNKLSYSNDSKVTLLRDNTKTETYYGFVKDAAGNKDTCQKEVKKGTLPTCSLAVSCTKSNGWCKDDATISLTKGNGATDYTITKTSTVPSTYTNKSITVTNDTTGTVYYGHVKDSEGNEGMCNITVKKDATSPTCTLLNTFTAKNGWCKSNSTISFKNKSSDVNSYGITTSTTATYNSKTSVTHSKDTTGTKYYGFVKDAAGNTGSCNLTVKKDTVSPSVPTVNLYKWKNNDTKPTSSSGLSTYTNNTWYNGKVFSIPSSSDATSGVSYYLYTTTGKTSNETDYKSAYRNIEAQGTSYVKFKACDAAENCSNYSANKVIKLDRSAPSVPTIKNPSSGKWTKNNFKLTLTSSDSYSGIKNYQYTYSASATATGSNNATQWVAYIGGSETNDPKYSSNNNQLITSPFSLERNQLVYIRACDNVGICSAKTSTWIRIDKTPPKFIKDAYQYYSNWGPSRTDGKPATPYTIIADIEDVSLAATYYQYCKAGTTNCPNSASQNVPEITNQKEWKPDGSAFEGVSAAGYPSPLSTNSNGINTYRIRLGFTTDHATARYRLRLVDSAGNTTTTGIGRVGW